MESAFQDRKRWPLMLLVGLFLLGPFVYHLGKTTLHRLEMAWASRAIGACPAAVDPYGCYGRVFSRVTGRVNPQALEELCPATGDPLCYRAYGRLVPSPSYCFRLNKYGALAVWQCHEGYSQR